MSSIYMWQFGLNASIHSGDKVQIKYFSIFFIACDLENEVKVTKIESVLLHLSVMFKDTSFA